MAKGILYFAGIGAGVLYLLGDLVGGQITPGYSYIKNAVSELIQSGAVNRPFLSSFLFLHALLILLFSMGLMGQHPWTESKTIYVGGVLLLIVGFCHLLTSSIFPMDPVGAESTFPGVMHLIFVGFTVVLIFILMPLLGVGLYRYYEWRNFLIFTLACLAIILISGFSSPFVIQRGIEVMGLTERITGYTFYFWLFALAVLLLRERSEELSLILKLR